MTVIVRDLRPEVPADVEGFVLVRRLALPFVVTTPQSVVHTLTRAHNDAHFRQLVAEADGEIIGTAQVGIAHDSPEPGKGYLNVYTHPGHLRRGAGSLLTRVGEEHLASLGATQLFAWVLDEPDNRAFAERHGYKESRSAHFLRLDLANGTLPPLPDPPPGVELRTAADFADDPRPLFELDAETAADEPSDVGTEFTDYAAWIDKVWEQPLLDFHLTTVAVVEGRPAAFTLAQTDGLTRYSSGMTGTARAFRNRGLAGLAKVHSLHRARARGYTDAYTGNDTGNSPMLAVNTWLGYEICATEVRYARALV